MNDRLTFVNVTLSGRRYFTQDCATEDWCTHCLDLNLLVASEEGSYQTVIDHHVVNPNDSGYAEWQEKCGALAEQNVFQVYPGAELTFEGCDVLDIRFRPSSFVLILDSTLVLARTNIRRMDAAAAFISAKGSTKSVLIIASCYVTGLNRDHSYNPSFSTDAPFLTTLGTQLNLTISNSSFEDNLLQENNNLGGQGFIGVDAHNLDLTDSSFLRCRGTIIILFAWQDVQGHINNVTFQAMSSNYSMLILYSMSSSTITLTNCSFIDNQSVGSTFYAYGNIVQNKMLYRNNRIIHNYHQGICEVVGAVNHITNSVFKNNGAYDSTVEAFWADYYVEKGLLDDNGLTAQKKEILRTSRCRDTLSFSWTICPKILNVTILEDQGQACISSLSLVQLFPDDQESLAVIENLWIASQAASLLSGILEQQKGIVYLANSVLELGGSLLVFEGRRCSILLMVSNVTFQYAKGTTALTSPVSLSGISGFFRQCQWKHNKGNDSGALTVYLSSLGVHSSIFLNNSCSFRAGNVLLAADNKAGVSLYITNSTFSYSHSVLGAACIQVTGNLSLGAEISNSTFQHSISHSNALLVLAHNSGQLFLTNITISDINSLSTSLIMIMTPTPIDGNRVETIVELLTVFNCTFSKGLVLLTERGSPLVTLNSNQFSGNNGTLIWVNAGNISDWGSEYRTNVGHLPLYYQGAGSKGLLHSVLFDGNAPSETMGLVYLESSAATLSMVNCTFRSNSAPSATALLFLQQEATATLTHCLFENNIVLGAVIFARFVSFTLESTSFTNHSSLLRLEDASAFVTASAFVELHTFATLVQSSLAVQNSTVRQLIGSYDCLVSGISSNVSLADMTLERIRCDAEVITMLIDSRLWLDGTSMRDVESGSRVIMINTGHAVITKTALLRVEGVLQLILLANTTVTLQETTITDSLSSIIRASETLVTLDSCLFARIHTSQKEGVLSCTGCRNISVTRCVFEDISAGSVAGIRVDAAAFQIEKSTFRSLEARDSGALQIDSEYALVSACWFANNTASSLYSSGGALRLNAITGLISTSLFYNNTAFSGGAIHWVAGNITWQNNTLQSNRATYGPDIASFPAYLQADQDAIHISSGKLFQSALIVRLLDHFSQVVSTDNSTEAWLASNLSMSGNLKARAVAGLLTFTGFSVTAQPGSSIRLLVATSLLRLPLTLIFRSCETGEVETKNMCVRCPAGTYSLSSNDIVCKLCLEHAQCPGGSQIYPEPAYWRSGPQFEEVFRCPRADACLGHVNFSSEVGYCANHYTGAMCQSCVTGAMRTGRDGCALCASNLEQELRAVGLGTGLVGLWLFVSATGHATEQVALFRIAIDYLQFVALVADFDFDWPVSLQDFYHLHHYLGNAAQHFLFMDCLTSDAFVVKTLAAALAPVVLVLLFAIIWSVVRLIYALRKRSIPLFKKYASSVIVSFAYLHCFILREALTAFHCITINPGESWLRAELAVRCWDQRHLTYVLAVALPTALLWGVGVPGLLLLLQVRRHRKADAVCALPAYLSAGFKSNIYFWELVIVCFKAAVVVIYVSMANLPPSTQALTLVLLLSAATALQSKVTPFQAPVLNRTQLVSSATVLLNAYSGLYFVEREQSTVLAVFVLFLHCCFILFWGLAFFGARLKSWLLRCFRRG